MTISLLIDGLVLTLLAGALIYGVILSRRIARLQSALVELAPALQAFCDAVDQSERSVGEIRREADRLQEENSRSARLTATRSLPGAPAKPAVSAKNERSDLVRRFFETARMRTQ